MLGFASPYEIVVWRVVFGFLTAVLLIAVTKNFKSLRETFKNRANITWIAASAIFIFINWLVYVIAISEHHVVESSLGYFINPLVTILLAVVFLREKLSPVQWVAMSFGALAVIVLTIDYGRPPWIALILAGSFGIYGLAKNKLGGKVSALNSFAIESGFVVPIAIVQLFLIQIIGVGILFASQIPDNWGLEFAGTLALIAVIVPMLDHRAARWAAGAAAIVAVLAFALPLKLNLTLAIIAAIMVGILADRSPRRPR
jgi:chloramphenicol-sensitive protein RarD